MKEHKIIYVHPDSLKSQKRNPRTHTAKQISQIARSISEFGFLCPVLIDGESTLLVGHARVKAAKQLGLTRIPSLLIDHLTPVQRRAYVIADNRIAENAGWDNELLALELQDLDELELDLTLTGFETAEIDLLLSEVNEAGSEAAEVISEPDRSKPAQSKLGDLWLVGNHALYCGSALDAESYDILLGSKKASMIFTDPPYNVPIAGHVSGLGKKTHREFEMASGEMTSQGFVKFLRTAITHAARQSVDGSLHFICMDWRHIGELLDATRSTSSSSIRSTG